MRLKISEILPNPYRNLKENPLIQGKIEELKHSINTTEFWDNVVVRKRKDGKYELAYGHHRLEALKQLRIKEADFIVKKFDDLQMVQVLRADNHEAYASRPVPCLFESVRAVMRLLDEGKIGPFKIDPKTKKSTLRYAPSYVAGKTSSSESDDHKAYTILDIAKKLGETKDDDTQATTAIKAAIGALQLMEMKLLREADVIHLPVDFKNPKDPDNKNPQGLVQIVQHVQKTLADRAEVSKAVAAVAKPVQDEQRALEQKRKAETAKIEAERKKAREGREAAIKAEEKEKAEAYKKRQQELDKLDRERAEKDVIEGLKLEDKLTVLKKEAEEKIVQQQRDTALRKEVDAFIFKIEAIANVKGEYQEAIDRFFKKVTDTQQRMRLRNALSSTSNWMDEQCSRFLGEPPKQQSGEQVLAEAKQRETAKRKGEEAQLIEN